MTVLRSFPAGFRVLIQGASRGIGLEFCRQLAADDQVERLVATCRSPDAAPELAALSASHGERVLVERLDVTRRAVGESRRAGAGGTPGRGGRGVGGRCGQ